MELLEQIVRAGVVGLGGAGFPTGKKLDCRVEWLIVNGAECEPLLRTVRYLMRHNAGRVIRAAGAVARMVGAKHCVIALKRAYTQEWKALEAALAGDGPVMPTLRIAAWDRRRPTTSDSSTRNHSCRLTMQTPLIRSAWGVWVVCRSLLP